MPEVKKYIKKTDILFAVLVCLIAVATWIWLLFVVGKQGSCVEIYQDGQLYATYSLKDELSVQIVDKETGQSNVLVISDGVADVTEADCPDGLCVKQKAISKSGESIVCLPHKLVITVVGGEESGYDGFAQ